MPFTVATRVKPLVFPSMLHQTWYLTAPVTASQVSSRPPVLPNPVVITVTVDGVTYDEGTSLSSSSSGHGVSYNNSTGVYTLKISNSAGYELPSTGGTGTYPYTVVGLVLTMLSATAGLMRRRRKRKEEPL